MQEDIKNQQNENLKPDEKPVQKSDIKDQESAGDQILNAPAKWFWEYIWVVPSH